MSFLKAKPKAEHDYQLLQDYLCQHLYANADALYNDDPDDLVEYLFRQYYVFMAGSIAVEGIYTLFKVEAYRLMALRGQSREQTEYCLRSGRFISFVQDLLTGLDDEMLIT